MSDVLEDWYAYSQRRTVGPFPSKSVAWSYVEAQMRAGYRDEVWTVGQTFSASTDPFGDRRPDPDGIA